MLKGKSLKGVCLERLDESVEENPDADAPPEKLDESGGSEQLQEPDGDHLGGVDDAADHRDEVERVPRVFEVVLEQTGDRMNEMPRKEEKSLTGE